MAMSDTESPMHRLQRVRQQALWHRWDRRAQLVLVTVLVLLGGFAVAAAAMRRAEALALDIAVTHAVQQFDQPVVVAVMVGISALGYAPWSGLIVTAAALGCVAARWYREALFIVATEGVGWLAAEIKLLVERPRPTSDLVRVLGHVGETSFPSGHVTSYIVFYGLLFYFVYVRARRGWPRTVLLLVFATIVGLVGPSRIYLGHHWVSDVLGGYALGAAYLLLLLEIHRWFVLPSPVRHDRPAASESAHRLAS
jgi:membrane-associated phospholipid phosphatase